MPQISETGNNPPLIFFIRSVFSVTPRVFKGMTGKRGFTLIEIILVMAIMAIGLGLAGPRIGAGLSRIELKSSAQRIHGLLKMARQQAQSSDRVQYVILDKGQRSATLVNSEMKIVRQEALSSSIDLVLPGDSPTTAIAVSPSGAVRGAEVRLRSGSGEIEISFQ